MIAKISYGLTQYPEENDIVKEVKIENKSDHRMVVALTPGGSAKIEPHGTAVIKNPGGPKEKVFLKDGSIIYFGLDLTEEEKEDSVVKNNDTQDMVWRNSGTQDYSFQTYLTDKKGVEHKAHVDLNFKYNPEDKKVTAILSAKS